MTALHYHKNKTIVIPSSWNELSKRQFIKLVQLLHSGMQADEWLLDKALKILCRKKLYSFLRIPPDIRSRCYDHMEWIAGDEKPTEQLIPVYKNYYGPASGLENITLEEFHFAEIAYHRLVNEQEESAMNELIAILYRPALSKKKNIQGDMRQPFEFYAVQDRIRHIKKWSLQVRRCIIIWYDGCRKDLEACYPEVFTGEKASSKDYFDGMYNMIRSIAEKKTYGDFQKVEKMNIHLALRELTESKKEFNELKSKHPELYK